MALRAACPFTISLIFLPYQEERARAGAAGNGVATIVRQTRRDERHLECVARRVLFSVLRS